MKRILFALILAPLLGVLVGDIVVSVVYRWDFALLFTLFGALVAYPLVLLAGSPALWLMRRMNWLSIWAFLLVGVVLSAIGWAIMFWPFAGPSFQLHAISYGFFGFVSGVCGAAFFWVIGVRDNSTLTHHSSGTLR